MKEDLNSMRRAELVVNLLEYELRGLSERVLRKLRQTICVQIDAAVVLATHLYRKEKADAVAQEMQRILEECAIKRIKLGEEKTKLTKRGNRTRLRSVK